MALAIYEYDSELSLTYQVENEHGHVYAMAEPEGEGWIVMDPTLAQDFEQQCEGDPGLAEWLADDGWPTTEKIVTMLRRAGYDARAGWC